MGLDRTLKLMHLTVELGNVSSFLNSDVKLLFSCGEVSCQSDVGEWLMVFCLFVYPHFLHKCSITTLTGTCIEIIIANLGSSFVLLMQLLVRMVMYHLQYFKVYKNSASGISLICSAKETFAFWRVGNMTVFMLIFLCFS